MKEIIPGLAERIFGKTSPVDRFVTGTSGRRIDFSNGLPLVWGVEVDLPIGKSERNAIFERSLIKIPKRVKTIKYVTMDPQESLPSTLRNIRSDFDDHRETSLTLLADSVVRSEYEKKHPQDFGRDNKKDKSKRAALGDLFKVVFGNNFGKIQKFNRALKESRGNEVVVIEGHGNGDPWVIGEQYSSDPEEMGTQKLQKMGNSIPIEGVINKYNDRNVYSGLVIVTCYLGTKGITDVNVPVAYIKGEADYIVDAATSKPKTAIVIPGH